jgi:hypothetical protein
MVTSANQAILALGANAAVQNIHAPPNRAQTIAPRALPFDLAPLDIRGVSLAIKFSVT